MAQEYLMDVIIQIFPDEFHIQTLKPFLLTIAQLHKDVNIKMLIMSLIERLTSFTSNEDEQENIPQDIELFAVFWNEIMELIEVGF
jgi:vacuolar protein sorting-associated protein 35